ncbi:MAG TPA: CRISPR-associated protein Cas4 [Hymenobacter sp.]|jgi:CRISPR-associated exonuclease Cas4
MRPITATLINLYHICHRELWLHANEIRMEFFSDAVQDGKQIHETSYPQRPERYREIVLGGSKIDFYDAKAKVVHEIKRGNKAKEAHVAQVKYYLWLLEQHGVSGATGLLEYPRLRQRQVVTLEAEDYATIVHWESEIHRIIKSPTCPPTINKPFCKQCSYYELCYVSEAGVELDLPPLSRDIL